MEDESIPWACPVSALVVQVKEGKPTLKLVKEIFQKNRIHFFYLDFKKTIWVPGGGDMKLLARGRRSRWEMCSELARRRWYLELRRKESQAGLKALLNEGL